jgi:hypothetical protein
MKTKRRLFSMGIALVFVLCAAMPAFAQSSGSAIQAGKPTITRNTTVVGFAGQEWWVIGDADGGVYSQPNSLTLLHKNSLTYGTTAFRLSSNTTYTTNPSDYAGSTLQQRMVAIADGFPSTESALINPRTLKAGDDTNYPITGGDVANQKLWALSYDEGATINDNTVHNYGAIWWLRSPYNNAYALSGSGNSWGGGPTITANLVEYDLYYARPALNLTLPYVFFTSAASGANAKPALDGGKLTAASAPPATGSVKFTVSQPGFTLTHIAANQSERFQYQGNMIFFVPFCVLQIFVFDRENI